MIPLRRRARPYVVGEIGFLVTRFVNEYAVVELRDRAPSESAGSNEAVIGMGCVELLTVDGACARMLNGAELDDALSVFGYPGLRFAMANTTVVAA